MRRLIVDMTTYEHISRTGERYTIRMLSILKNFETTFRLDTEFEEENFDGRRVKVKNVVMLIVIDTNDGGTELQEEKKQNKNK